MEMNSIRPSGLHSEQSEFRGCIPTIALGALSAPSPIRESFDPKAIRRGAPKETSWSIRRPTPASHASPRSPKTLFSKGHFSFQQNSFSANLHDGTLTPSTPAPVNLISVPDYDTSAGPRGICSIGNVVENAPIADISYNEMKSEEEDCVSLPLRGSPADLLCDLFPELQTFTTPLSDGVEAMDSRAVPVRNIQVNPTHGGLKGHNSPAPGGVTDNFAQMPWALPRPSLEDLSLLSNDEMDLELERFGYNNCFDSKDDSSSLRDGAQASHNQSCSNDNNFQQGSTPTPEETHSEGSELQDSYLEILYPQGWEHLQGVYSGGFPRPHPLQLEEAYLGLDVTMTNDRSAFNLPPSESLGPLGTQMGSFISCPYPRNSLASLYIDKSGVIKDACYCEEGTDVACTSHFGAIDGASYSLTSDGATSQRKSLQKPHSDFVASPYPYLRPRLYSMHPPYGDEAVPHYDGYTSVESDTTSSYALSRPSSCTISRSVSAQGNSFLGNFEPPHPLQPQGSHGSSPEWTPPSTPLYVQFHSTYNFGNTQVESSQNPIRVQNCDNQARSYSNFTPTNDGFIPTQVTFTENGSKLSAYTAMRKSCIEPRQDNNELLVRLRDQGVSYKEIKKRLNCPEAESTLRGRHRTLTKEKSQRVRKPVWTDNDVRILINCVTSLILSPQNSQVSEERESGCKISARWKYISEEILRVGGSYKFGPGTCKKKYKELVETGAAPAIQELEKRRGCRGEAREERCARLRGRRKSAKRSSKSKCSTK